MILSTTQNPKEFALAASVLQSWYLRLLHILTVLLCLFLFSWPVLFLPLAAILMSAIHYRWSIVGLARGDSLTSLTYRGDQWQLGFGANVAAGTLCWCQLSRYLLVAKFDLDGGGHRQITVFSDQLSRENWRQLRTLLIHARPINVDRPL